MTTATTSLTQLTNTDRQAVAAFRRGRPVDRAFTVTLLYPCAHCGVRGTTASGALWRVSLADRYAELYYLHTGCLLSYKRAHGLRSVEGRRPLAATPTPTHDQTHQQAS